MPSQSDIARDNQKGIEKANKRDAEKNGITEDDRATQFDGNPNAEGVEGGTFHPQDDTPFIIKKRDDTDK